MKTLDTHGLHAIDALPEGCTFIEIVRDGSGAAAELRIPGARRGESRQSFGGDLLRLVGGVADGGPPLDFEYQSPVSGMRRVRVFRISPASAAAVIDPQDHYRLLFSSINDMILVHPFHEDLSPETFIEVNEAACQRLGYTRQELLRMSSYDIDAPEGLLVIREAMARLRADGHALWEGVLKDRDGRKFPVEISNRLFTLEGRPMILATIRDITARKRAEQAVRESEERYRALQATLLEITRPREISQLLTEIVKRAVHLLHATGGGLYLCNAEQRLARCVVSYNTPVDYTGTILRYGEGSAGIVAQTGKPLLIEDYSTWSGRAGPFDVDKPFKAVASVPLLWNGQVTGVLHVLSDDISFSQAELDLLSLFAEHAAIAAENARLRDGLEQELRERRRLEVEGLAATQRLEFVVGATSTGFDIIDDSFTMQYIDPTRMAKFGDYHGRKCYEYFRGRSTPCDECAMMRALSTHSVAVEEQTNPGDTTLPTQVTAIPFQTESGQWMVAEVSVDISERKQAEAERLALERRVLSAQKLEGLGVLAGGVAHNFNNLLSVMLGYAQLLKEMTPQDAEFKPAAEEIIRAGFRARDLVGQLLAVGRKQAIDLVPLDLNQVIEDSRTILRQAIRENITLHFALSPAPCPVLANAASIEQVLLNLALNAQDAIAGDGRLSFETSEITLGSAAEPARKDLAPGRYILLAVNDTGAGMDHETMERIFEPFFTTKQEGKGTGLGLSTVYGVVRQHGGAIDVESQPGKGTWFTILIPRTDLPPRRQAGLLSPA
ncbi:MAG: ATP-binding protein [Spirochaetia bacterium]